MFAHRSAAARGLNPYTIVCSHACAKERDRNGPAPGEEGKNRKQKYIYPLKSDIRAKSIKPPVTT
jgi:hypothetical protein